MMLLLAALLQLAVILPQGQSTIILTPRELLASAQDAGGEQVIYLGAGQVITLRDTTSRGTPPTALPDGLVLRGAGATKSILDLRRLGTSGLALQAGECNPPDKRVASAAGNAACTSSSSCSPL